MYGWWLRKNTRPTGSQAVEAFMPSRAKAMGVEVWSFRGTECNSQEDEESKYLANNMCWPYRNDRAQR